MMICEANEERVNAPNGPDLLIDENKTPVYSEQIVTRCWKLCKVSYKVSFLLGSLCVSNP